MSQEREPRSSLRELLSSGNFAASNAPRLRRFRLLQWIALATAAVWIIAALTISHQLIHQQLHAELEARLIKLNKEIQFSLRVFDQNLHQAEQLSTTLSFEQSTIALLSTYKNKPIDLNTLNLEARHNALMRYPGVKDASTLFKHILSEVDATQVYLMDPLGYCIASGQQGQPGDGIGGRYHTRKYYQDALMKGRGRQFAIGKQYTVPSFFFSTAIKDGEELLGIVVLRLLTGEVVDFINPSMDLTLITSANGVVLASSEPELNFKHVGRRLSHPPPLMDYRRIFKREKMDTVPFKETSYHHGLSLWNWGGERHLMARGLVEQGDYQVFLFDNVESILDSSQKRWALSLAILLTGLLINLLIERSINFSQLRKAHLKALFDANKDLSNLSAELYQLTVTDTLTGASSRRYFSQKLEDAVQREHRQSPAMPRSSEAFKGLSLLLLDIDRFKLINDSYGHPAGDVAIRTMAKICQEQVRPYDTVGRMGGEEFAILLSDVTMKQTKEIAARILRVCESTEIRYEEHCFTQTCSIGVARLRREHNTDSLLSQADKALYAAKEQGRNRFVYF